MKLNDLADEIFVLNLAHRSDRLFWAQEQSERFGLDFTVFRALDGNSVPNPTILRPGEYGLLCTYRELIKYAKNEKLASILVFEDDFEMVSDFSERLEKEWPEVPENWDMVYLGANNYSLGAGTVPPEKITDNVMRIFSSFGCQSVLIKSHMYDPILELIERFDRPLDVAFTDLQQNYNVYSFCKSLIKQRDCYSDIILQTPNYNQMGVFS